MHTVLELQKVMVDSFDDELNLSRKEVTGIKFEVEEQKARLGAAGVSIVDLKNCRDEASASTDNCQKELHPMHKDLAAAREKVKNSSTRAVLMTKGRDAASTKFEELRSRVEQRVGFANKRLARSVAKVVKET